MASITGVLPFIRGVDFSLNDFSVSFVKLKRRQNMLIYHVLILQGWKISKKC